VSGVRRSPLLVRRELLAQIVLLYSEGYPLDPVAVSGTVVSTGLAHQSSLQ